MGYYLDFVFDTPQTHESVVGRLLSAGAIRVPAELLEKPRDEFWYPAKTGGDVPWVRASRGLLVYVYTKEASPTGNWADTRLSWATPGDEWRELMGTVFRLAREIQCRVYDGQIGTFVNPDDWEALILQVWRRTSGAVVGMFGSVRVESPGGGDSLLERRLEDVGALSARTAGCLRSSGIMTIGELVAKTAQDLLAIPNFTAKCLQEIRDHLAEHGLSLSGDS